MCIDIRQIKSASDYPTVMPFTNWFKVLELDRMKKEAEEFLSQSKGIVFVCRELAPTALKIDYPNVNDPVLFAGVDFTKVSREFIDAGGTVQFDFMTHELTFKI